MADVVHLLQENEANLQMTMSHGCHFNGKSYSFGMQKKIGAVGPGHNEPKYVPRTTIPEAVVFSIQFTESQIKLYDDIVAALEKTAPKQYSATPPTSKDRPQRVKKEFEAQVAEQNAYYTKLELEISECVEKMQSLGAFDIDFEYPQRPTNPKDWYEEYGPIEYTAPRVCIFCHRGTELYRQLHDAGLIQKYCPASYISGEPFAVQNGVWNYQPLVTL